MDADEKTIEHLVTIAAHDVSGKSRIELVRALNAVELFYAATTKVVDDREVLSTPLRQLSDGSYAMRVYTSKKHSDLPKRFAGVQWPELLNIAYESVRADWLVIINLNNDIVAFSREQLQAVIAELITPKASPPAEHATTRDELELAISAAVHTSSDDWYEPVLARLRGRELFLHLTDAASPGAQPTMRTSTAGGRGGWILTFTTRNRPGITYGGIRWENLVAMINENKEMPGVQVVNDGDDWILLGRDVI